MNNIKDNLKQNVIVKGPFFNEEIRIATIINMGSDIKIIGKGLKTGMFYEPVLDDERFQNLKYCQRKNHLMVILLDSD